MGALKRLNDVLCAILQACCLILVLIFTVTVLFQVTARNYLLISVPWTDEMSVILFIWSVFLGAAVGLRKRSHFLVDLFPESWKKTNSFFDLFSSVMILGIAVVLLWGGSIFFQMGIKRNFNSIIVSKSWLFISMPISAACMILFSIENIAADIKRFRGLLKGGDA
ncbi:MAG: TRAP transporter small permease [Synergistaceae bacterium]|jgi:TRAP-type C4-dicarboxylate transport system permease small subunit|nr:TRAP transporter small permease [Synergistaceae bacterium]